MGKSFIPTSKNVNITMTAVLSESPTYNGNHDESSIIFGDVQLISGGKKSDIVIFNNGGELSYTLPDDKIVTVGSKIVFTLKKGFRTSNNIPTRIYSEDIINVSFP